MVRERVWTRAILSQMVSKDVNSGYICGGKSLTWEAYDAETKNKIWKDIYVWDKLQREYVNFNIEPTKAKRLSSVLVEREYKVYCSVYVLLLFHLNLAGVELQEE